MRKILLLTATVLMNCSTQLPSEQEVIDATFMKMVGTYYYNKPPPHPPYKPRHPDSIYNEMVGTIGLTILIGGNSNKIPLTGANFLIIQKGMKKTLFYWYMILCLFLSLVSLICLTL